MLSVERDAIYVALPRTEPGVAVGGRALPSLPSSRAAVLGTTATSTLMPYPRFVERKYDSDRVIEGELMLPLTVRLAGP